METRSFEAISSCVDECAQHPHSFCIRVPGKSLLSGGYLILDEPNRGLSVAVTAHTLAKVKRERAEGGVEITVDSPSMGQQWSYHINSTHRIIPSLYCCVWIAM